MTANVKRKKMNKKERFATAIQISGRVIKDILLKKEKDVVAEELRLARWHWKNFFQKK